MADPGTPEPFDSIESAQDFVGVLGTAILDSIRDLERERRAALGDGDERRVQGIELAIYKLRMLSVHVHKSSRILNDLRSLRRLLLQERSMDAFDEAADSE